MRLKTPSFWYEPAGLKAWMLSPAVPFYLAGHKLRQCAVTPAKAAMPVICIGNLVAGGGGKTPAALALMQLVKDTMPEMRPCFLTRGYGGEVRGPLLVEKGRHRHPEVGDEALLLADKAPTIISADRAAGAQYARQRGFNIIVMDDGLQNPGLHKDLRFIVIDGATGFGNGLPLPAGPLREPLREGLNHADAFIIVGEDVHRCRNRLPPGIPVFIAKIEVSENWIADPNIPYLAFCGLAHPEKFRRTLAQKQLNVLRFRAFPDHYPFTQDDLASLHDEAEKLSARLITTAKDAARLPADFTRETAVDVLPVDLQWAYKESVVSFLRDRLKP